MTSDQQQTNHSRRRLDPEVLAGMKAKMAEKVRSTPFEIKASPGPLSSFLEQLMEDIDNNLQTAAEETSQFLQHCKKKCGRLLQSSQAHDLKPENLKDILQETAHMVLDYTYLDETLLVEAEFPSENVSTRIGAIQDQLDRISQVAKECFENQPVLESLGVEVVECIHWRKGALLYMYCHTVETNGRQREPSHYKQCLEEGVGQLEKMLSTRQPTTIPSSISADDTLQLFSQGVYSDTHLLAMMYAAELCFWHQQAVDKGLFSQDAGDSNALHARLQGLRHLDRYLGAVNGPLKGQDWTTSRAEEIAKYFREGH